MYKLLGYLSDKRENEEEIERLSKAIRFWISKANAMAENRNDNVDGNVNSNGYAQAQAKNNINYNDNDHRPK